MLNWWNYKNLEFQYLRVNIKFFVAIKMEKGDGNGEGWGVGKDQGAGKWKVGLFESYKPSLGCKYDY